MIVVFRQKQKEEENKRKQKEQRNKKETKKKQAESNTGTKDRGCKRIGRDEREQREILTKIKKKS